MIFELMIPRTTRYNIISHTYPYSCPKNLPVFLNNILYLSNFDTFFSLLYIHKKYYTFTSTATSYFYLYCENTNKFKLFNVIIL